MKKLPLMDSAWLTLESADTPMHVGCLQLFQLPENAPEDYLQQLMARWQEFDQPEAPFNRKLAWPLKGLKQPHWATADDFDIGYHVRHSALPKPGRVRELLVLVSRLHASLLDRSRPLWELHLIEGLDNKRFAIYTKIHHSVVDGVAGMRLMQDSLSNSAERSDLPPPWAQQRNLGRASKKKPAAETPAAGPTSLSSQTLGTLASKAGSVPALASSGTSMLKSLGGGKGVAPYQAPKSMINTRVSNARRFVAQSYSLSRIRAVAKRHDATLNDIVMAMCGSSLRRYLLEHEALPEKPLIGDVPVSVRPADAAKEGGNAISLILTTLATDLDDPVARLKAIQASMQAGKDKLAGMSAKKIANYTTLVMLPFTIGQLVGTAGRIRPMFNVVISNVPGPKQPLYLSGARMTGMYPVSLLFNGQALNITVTSYEDSLDFGIIACRRSLPSVQRLIDHLETALAELE